MSLFMRGKLTYGHKWVVLVARLTCVIVYAFLSGHSSETSPCCNHYVHQGSSLS